jgi:hypothetical protein
MIKIIVLFIAIVLAMGVACAMAYIIGVTKGFGDCYDLMKKDGRIEERPQDDCDLTD